MSASIASPTSSRRASLVAALGLACLPVGAVERAVLPVFLADNHAETFGWVTRVFDLDAPHTLVLVDAHSDASVAERSEEIREQIRRVVSIEERATRIEEWRAGGRLQAYNWLEPLMPRPVERVLWIPRPELSSFEARLGTCEAAAQLDGRLEVEPRSSGSFEGRWETRDLRGLLEWTPAPDEQVILGIDLDFFTGMETPTLQRHFDALWTKAMDWPGLRGVACSISRPWQRDDEEAGELVALLIGAVARTPQASLEIDASLDDRPDRSLKAAEFAEEVVPRWDWEKARQPLRSRLLGLAPRLTITDRNRSWPAIFEAWEANAGQGMIRPESGEVDLDEVWRFPLGGEPVLRLVPPRGATGKVRWYRLDPARFAYDLVPETGLGKEFSASPGRWLHETRTPLGETQDFLLAPHGWSGGPGRFRIVAECETAEGWIAAAPVELRIAQGAGFRGALSECFGMPYVFGIAFARAGDLTGVETGWGADCSNLMIHAWRRQGVPLIWGDPGMLRRQLATKVEKVERGDHPAISPSEIEAGLLIDFGRHVAAVWEDREPLGLLDENDLVIHHLGGLPEVVTLAALTSTRPTFALRGPPEASGIRLALAGDVVLSGNDLVAIHGFERGDADLFLVNLEGIPSLREAEVKPRYDFRFPPERLSFLTRHGIDAVSLANNHALDAGPKGLIEGLENLRSAGIPAFGAGSDEVGACQPWRIERGGRKVAVFGVSLLPGCEAGPGRPGVAALPAHADLLASEMGSARERGESVIVFVHGGEEYRSEVSEEQRRWARWLIARGASVIAGAHPHVLQKTERHAGAVCLHSLGNAVYPSELKGADSGIVIRLTLPASDR